MEKTHRWLPTEGLQELMGTDGRGTRPMNESERAWYARYTVFLGSHGNFDMWGNPETGYTCYVGTPIGGCLTGSFGDRWYWRSMLGYWHGRDDEWITDAGRSWGIGPERVAESHPVITVASA